MESFFASRSDIPDNCIYRIRRVMLSQKCEKFGTQVPCGTQEKDGCSGHDDGIPGENRLTRENVLETSKTWCTILSLDHSHTNYSLAGMPYVAPLKTAADGKLRPSRRVANEN